MSAIWKDKRDRPSRHPDADAAIAEYLEQLRQADISGTRPPAGALNGLGDAHLDTDDVASAVEYYRQAAEAYAEDGRLNHAIACCQKIRRYAPDDLQVGLLLGRYHGAKGLVADALIELKNLVERQKGAGNMRLALEGMREIVTLEPDHPEHRERLADLSLADGDPATASEALAAALERYETAGEEAAAHRVRRRLEDLKQAGALIAPEAPPSLVKPPPQTKGLRAEAEQYRSEGRWIEAIEAYRRLSESGQIRGSDFDAWSECARQSGRAANVLESLSAASRWHLDAGNTEAARRSAEEMMLIDPTNETAAEILQWVGEDRSPR
jgi:tetratricopeptide (TPR) repeat protein